MIRELLAREEGPPIVALARRPDAVPRRARLSVRRAEYEEPSSLRRSLAGVRTLVFVSSDGDAVPMRRHHENAVAAAVDAGVDHVVYTSTVDIAPDSRFYYAAVHRDTEALLAESGLDRCLARTSIFADYFVSTWIDPALAHGTLALPAGTGRMAFVTRDDTAKALAAAAIGRREGTVELTGPDALTVEEARRITEAETGRRLRYRAIDEDAYRRRLAGERAPGWLIEAFSSLFGSVREGRFETVSALLPELTREPRQSFSEFIRSSGRCEART